MILPVHLILREEVEVGAQKSSNPVKTSLISSRSIKAKLPGVCVWSLYLSLHFLHLGLARYYRSQFIRRLLHHM